MYEVLEGYWKYSPHVVVVTDDVWFARSALLQRLDRLLIGGLTKELFAEFEGKFSAWVTSGYGQRQMSTGGLPFTYNESMYFSIGDNHYQIRLAQQHVAVGGMSTIQTGAR